MSMLNHERAILVLEDGACFKGTSVGSPDSKAGEVVFNTSITGYQEILTDPSYRRQIVTLTYPHIGNVGVNPEDMESSRCHLAGLLIKDLSLVASNYRKSKDLKNFLVEQGVPAIAGIDTRRLTRLLRQKGAQNGCLMVGEINEEEALKKARSFSGLKGMDLAAEVSCTEPYSWDEGEWRWGRGFNSVEDTKLHVVAYDYGIKKNILRNLVSRGCRVTVVPATMDASDVMRLGPDGVFLSNGPGDPEPCKYAIRSIRSLLKEKIPIFGVCLGHQLLALACGARTKKMKFGHHGANHPVRDIKTGKVVISSQNHGFCVAEDGVPSELMVTHRSLFDGSIQGIELVDGLAFSFQGHPEASPGPHDIQYLFNKFVDKMRP